MSALLILVPFDTMSFMIKIHGRRLYMHPRWSSEGSLWSRTHADAGEEDVTADVLFGKWLQPVCALLLRGVGGVIRGD